MRKYLWYGAGILSLVASPAAAQREVMGMFYGGVPVPMGTTSDYVGPEFSWGGGVRWAKPTSPFALRFDIRNSRFAVHEEVFQDSPHCRRRVCPDLGLRPERRSRHAERQAVPALWHRRRGLLQPLRRPHRRASW